MKKLVQFIYLFILICVSLNLVLAQKPNVKPFAMTADKNKNLLGLTRTPSASNLTWTNWWVTNGLPVVAAGTNAYVYADTLGGTWSLTSVPSGSAAVISKIKNAKTSVTYDSIATFIADKEGSYIVSYKVGTKTALDTIFAGHYVGVGTISDTSFATKYTGVTSCGSTTCHAGISYWSSIVTGWSKTKHANIFWKGVNGQMEFGPEYTAGTIQDPYRAAYRATCVPCHVTGFNSGPTNQGTASNGFFDQWLANKFTSPDTSYSYGKNALGQSEAMFRYDFSMWTGMSKGMKQLGNIGCEACHGPYVADHTEGNGFAAKNMVSREVGLCASCHDSPDLHAVVPQFMSSGHGISELVDDDFPAKNATTGLASAPRYCIKCHTRDGFMKARDPHATTPATFSSADMGTKFTCVMCHQPHTADKKQVRLVTNAVLQVSGKPITIGGAGQVCMYCHMARRGAVPAGRAPFIIEQQMTTKDTIWIDALGKLKYPNYTSASVQSNPHAAPQADMLMGSSAYEFEERFAAPISGLETHAGLESGCATCHMAKQPYISSQGYSLTGYHTFKMAGPQYTKVVGKTGDNTTACKSCHGEVAEFKEIKAANDYDGNGKIEGVQSEVTGMIKKLEDNLFVGKWGLTKVVNATTGAVSWTTSTQPYKDMMLDTNKVKIFFNYNFVKNDKSNGIHNTKYTVQLLARSMIAGGLADVKQPDAVVPKVYALSNNYPNPFNPSTNINFTVPKDAPVKIYVYDMAGRLVSTIIDSYFMSGSYTATWDGKTSSGTVASSGMYFYKMVSKNFVETKKMILMK